MPLYQERWVARCLDVAEEALASGREDDVAVALAPLPSEFFLLLYFDRPKEWPKLSAWLPALPSEGDQRLWAGNSGLYLMHQASLFLDDVFAAYGRSPLDAKVLDYGCGWGRMIRLLYNRVKLSNIHGVDPWGPSFDRMAAANVHATLGEVDYIPEKLPFDKKFDVIYAFSVFTHISARSQNAVLKVLRRHIADDGLLAVTIRQANYWPNTAWPDEARRKELLEQHLKEGFVFAPHEVTEGSHQTSDYGDTSQTAEYIEREWTEWKLERLGWRMADEYQAVAFLRPK